jgi:hypothetical protein
MRLPQQPQLEQPSTKNGESSQADGNNDIDPELTRNHEVIRLARPTLQLYQVRTKDCLPYHQLQKQSNKIAKVDSQQLKMRGEISWKLMLKLCRISNLAESVVLVETYQGFLFGSEV